MVMHQVPFLILPGIILYPCDPLPSKILVASSFSAVKKGKSNEKNPEA